MWKRGKKEVASGKNRLKYRKKDDMVNWQG
jgi:hypothetical protein